MAAAARNEIVSFCDELLGAAEFADHCPNGLQVPGAEEVTRVVSGVTSNLELLRAATGSGAELIVVHHGLFWSGTSRALDPALAERLRTLLAANASLLAYHLPLDAHVEIGNNALLCEALGFEPDGRFGTYEGREIGIIGRAAEPPSFGQLAERARELTEREPIAFAEGPDRVQRLGIVSGGGAFAIEEAAALGLDAFLTGEVSEPALASARENSIGVIAAGHHATERIGVRRLGELIAERFGIDHDFIEIPNPI